jgi:ABC-type uncharacterized transport system permease subunit
VNTITSFNRAKAENEIDLFPLGTRLVLEYGMELPVTRRIDPLWAIKLLHTIVWAFLAGCVLALPIAAFRHRFDWAVILTTIIIIECAVLALNDGRCPLTDVAARFTDRRTENFDIYLPNWLARHNKTIFGTLFLVNEVIVLACLLR